MIGKILGAVIGVAIAAAGYGLWRPAAFAGVFDFSRVSLGDFGQYRSLVSWLIMAVGLAVALAALQRPMERKRARPAAMMFAPDSETASVFAPQDHSAGGASAEAVS